MSTREKAIHWWNSLSSGYKTQLTDTNPEIVKTFRRWETLTGREIEAIYLAQDPIPVIVVAQKPKSGYQKMEDELDNGLKYLEEESNF